MGVRAIPSAEVKTNKTILVGLLCMAFFLGKSWVEKDDQTGPSRSKILSMHTTSWGALGNGVGCLSRSQSPYSRGCMMDFPSPHRGTATVAYLLPVAISRFKKKAISAWSGSWNVGEGRIEK